MRQGRLRSQTRRLLSYPQATQLRQRRRAGQALLLRLLLRPERRLRVGLPPRLPRRLQALPLQQVQTQVVLILLLLKKPEP